MELKDRFLKYVSFDTQSDESSETFPSTAKQRVLLDYLAEEMKALGEFFQKKPATHSQSADPDLSGVGRYIFTKGNTFSGVAACVSCHGPKGHGTPQLPRLAGQQALYLENQLKQFNKRERNNDNAVMHAVVEKMTALEMAAVAEYLSGK